MHDMERVRAQPGLFVVCFRNGVIMKVSPLLELAQAGILALTQTVEISLGSMVSQITVPAESVDGGETYLQTFLKRHFQVGRVGERVSLYHFTLSDKTVDDLAIYRGLEMLGGNKLHAGKTHVLALDLRRLRIVAV